MSKDKYEGWGYNIKIAEIPGIADHTWVNCPGHGKFACWGGTSGTNNRKFVTGSGSNYKVSNCYRKSWKDHPDTAGILYAVNGLCHQTANLFMYPSRTVLNLKVRGYWFSVATYGVHGALVPGGGQLPFFLGWLAAVYNPCYQKHKLAEADAEAEDADPIYARLEAMYARHGAADSANIRTVLAEELAIVTELQGPDIKYSTYEDLHQELMAAREGSLSKGARGRELAELVNAGVYRFQDGLSSRLDAQAYTGLTGLAPGEHLAIVDPEIAERTKDMEAR